MSHRVAAVLADIFALTERVYVKGTSARDVDVTRGIRRRLSETHRL